MLDYRHASHLFKYAKPDPQIYRCFENETGFHAEEILFFDDRIENIISARECGWQTVNINSSRNPVEQISTTLHEYCLLTV